MSDTQLFPSVLKVEQGFKVQVKAYCAASQNAVLEF